MLRKVIILTLFGTNLFLFIAVWYLRSLTPMIISGQVAGSRSKINPIELYEKTLVDQSYKTFNVGGLEKEIVPDWPKIKANNAVIVDITNNKILFEKNPNEKVPIASLAKIMTAVIALEHAKPDQIITVTKRAGNTPENFMGISAGEKYTLEQLLYGLILPSGNDAAEAIAEGVALDREMFIEWMNIKAKELNLSNTKFINPSGLNNEGKLEYSTAVDLAILARYALRVHPIFAKVVSTFSYTIPYSQDHKYLYFENQTNLLTSYPGVKGVKTGYTQEAGLSLVTYAENEGKQVIGVVLGSTDRRGDMILLLDKAFKELGVKVNHNLL